MSDGALNWIAEIEALKRECGAMRAVVDAARTFYEWRGIDTRHEASALDRLGAALKMADEPSPQDEIREARNEALEEAAKYMEDVDGSVRGAEYAAAIRKLKDKP